MLFTEFGGSGDCFICVTGMSDRQLNGSVKNFSPFFPLNLPLNFVLDKVRGRTIVLRKM